MSVSPYAGELDIARVATRAMSHSSGWSPGTSPAYGRRGRARPVIAGGLAGYGLQFGVVGLACWVGGGQTLPRRAPAAERDKQAQHRDAGDDGERGPVSRKALAGDDLASPACVDHGRHRREHQSGSPLEGAL